jgi:hypothetical protein
MKHHSRILLNLLLPAPVAVLIITGYLIYSEGRSGARLLGILEGMPLILMFAYIVTILPSAIFAGLMECLYRGTGLSPRSATAVIVSMLMGLGMALGTEFLAAGQGLHGSHFLSDLLFLASVGAAVGLAVGLIACAAQWRSDQKIPPNRRLRLAVISAGLVLILLAVLGPIRIQDSYDHVLKSVVVDRVHFNASGRGNFTADPRDWRAWPHRTIQGDPYTVVVVASFGDRTDMDYVTIDKVFVDSGRELPTKPAQRPVTRGDVARAKWESSFISAPVELPYADWQLRILTTWHLKGGETVRKEIPLLLPLSHRRTTSHDIVDALLSE